MKIYLAAQYHQKEEIAAKAKELADMGHTVTSTWFNEPEAPTVTMAEVSDSTLIEYAQRDLDEITEADMVILFTVDPTQPTKSGGRHFEFGFAYDFCQCAIVGPQENIFHKLPDILQFKTWEEAKSYLAVHP